jgi:hypothetical protein
VLLRCSQSPSIATCHFEEPTRLNYVVVFVFLLGVTSTKYGQLEVNLSLSGKQGGKSHL